MGEDRPALDVHLPRASPDLSPRLDALLDDFHPFAIEHVDAARCRVHFFETSDRNAASHEIARRLGAAGVRAVAVDVPDEHWAERSQAGLRAVRVGRVVITPPWDTPDVGPRDTLVVIRPSMGFGTGHHASTRLCLRALQACAVAGRTVIDVGTGSGVLAITAAKLGAASVTAVDTDADAVATARESVRGNQVADLVVVERHDFRQLTAPGAALVLANLSTAVVREHTAPLRRLVAPGGSLIVGGVLANEGPDLRPSLEPFGAIRAVYREDEWMALVLDVPPAPP